MVGVKMSEENIKIKKMTLTNTKKEMLDTYNELIKLYREQEQHQLKPQKISEEKTKKETIEKVRGISTEVVSKGINNLKVDINNVLSNLEENLEKEVKKYEEIQKAIKVKEEELKEIFEIEGNAYSLAALIESQNIKKQEFENDLEHKKETILKEIDNLRNEWEREKKTHETQIRERDEREKKESAREKEEYEYIFNRNKKIAKDKLNDELSVKENEFSEKVQQKTNELNEREREIKTRESEYLSMKEKVDKFQAELDAAIKKSIETTTQKLTAEAKGKQDLLTKEFEGEKNVLKTKIESLTKIASEQEKKISELTKKLDEAYQKVQGVAVKAIEGSSNSKAFDELQKILSDKLSNKVKD